MQQRVRKAILETIDSIREAGTYKAERIISTPQGANIQVQDEAPVLNMCANNYLGLANHPAVIQAAHEALDSWGYGLSSVRFICGTQAIHTQLEKKLTEFLQTEDTILYTSCFDANGGLFETLLDSEDAIISDQLNHASIIDGVRLCKAQRFRYANNDMADLEKQLLMVLHLGLLIKVFSRGKIIFTLTQHLDFLTGMFVQTVSRSLTAVIGPLTVLMQSLMTMEM